MQKAGDLQVEVHLMPKASGSAVFGVLQQTASRRSSGLDVLAADKLHEPHVGTNALEH